MTKSRFRNYANHLRNREHHFKPGQEQWSLYTRVGGIKFKKNRIIADPRFWDEKTDFRRLELKWHCGQLQLEIYPRSEIGPEIVKGIDGLFRFEEIIGRPWSEEMGLEFLLAAA